MIHPEHEENPNRLCSLTRARSCRHHCRRAPSVSSTGPERRAAAGAAATLNRDSGLVTTEALTTAAGAAYTLTLTNSKILPTSKIFVNVANGTNTQGVVSGSANAVAGNGTATVRVLNQHASQAFNGTLKISYLVINP